MIYHLAGYLQQFWGPFRLLNSYTILIAAGTLLSAVLVSLFLPKLWHLLPLDRGKAICGDDGMKSRGKPTGAGVIVTLLVLPAVVILVPFRFWDYMTVLAIYATMLCGYLDDRSNIPWGRARKGLLDGAFSVSAAIFIALGHGTEMWLPFVKGVWAVPLWAYIIIGSIVVWLSINATNCSDGVDGLAGSLTEISLVMLAVMLYVVVGYAPIARYFLIPGNPEAAKWAIVAMATAGGFGGYLWFNAEPSKVLMGDAGSRFLGILVGVLVLLTGNPFLIVALSPIVLVNGGGGILKILILKLANLLGFEIGDNAIIRKVRFPLHDHCKIKLKWSNAEVLMRFMLLQIVVMPVLLIILVKVR